MDCYIAQACTEFNDVVLGVWPLTYDGYRNAEAMIRMSHNDFNIVRSACVNDDVDTPRQFRILKVQNSTKIKDDTGIWVVCEWMKL